MKKKFLVLFGFFAIFLLSPLKDYAQTFVNADHPSTTLLVGGSAVVVAPSLTVTASGTIVDVKVSIETIVTGDVYDSSGNIDIAPGSTLVVTSSIQNP